MEDITLSFMQKKKKALDIIFNNYLSDRQKECLTMYYYKNMKLEKISQELGISISTVSRHISKAKKIIQEKSEYYI